MVVLDASIVNVALPSIQKDLHFTHLGAAVDRQRVHIDLRRFPLTRRSGRRPVRSPEDLPARPHRVHGLEPPRWSGPERDLADRRPSGAGAGRSDPGARHPDHPDLHLRRGSRLGPRPSPPGAPSPRPVRRPARSSAASSPSSSTGGGSSSSTCRSASWRWWRRCATCPNRGQTSHHRHLDLWGAVTVTAGLAALVYGVVRTETYSWGSAQVLLPLALGRAADRRLPGPASTGLEGPARSARASSGPARSPAATSSCC